MPFLCSDSLPVCTIQDQVDSLSNVEEAAIIERRVSLNSVERSRRDELFTVAKHEVVGLKDRSPFHLIVGECVRVRRQRMHLRLAKLPSTLFCRDAR